MVTITSQLNTTFPGFFLHFTFQKLAIQKLLSYSILTQNHQPATLSCATLHNDPNLEQTKQNHALIIKTFRTHFSPLARHNFLISSYIKNDQPRIAVNVYAYMRKNGTEVDIFTLPTVLKACSQVLKSQLGREIHSYAVKNGLDMDVFVANALIQMYGECGSVDSSRLVFDKMADRDIVSWSTMIRSYHKSRLFDAALEVIRKMQFLKIRLSEVAMISMVTLLADIANIKMGAAMHACIVRNYKSEKLGVTLATSLIDMYVKCGNLASARRLFDGLDQRSVVSWTAMIAGYIRCSKFKGGAGLFVQMMEENVIPSEITMLSLIIECGFVKGLLMGKWLHAYMLRNGFNMSSALATALIDMYGKCGEIASAKALFDSTKRKDVMIYGAMISAYAQAHNIDKAFELFVQMRESRIGPKEVTMVALLLLCAEAGALDLGRWIHAYIEKEGVGVDVVIKTAVVDMYAKCGDIHGAYRLFSEARSRDICMWNTIMTGYGMHGFGEEALKLFVDMERFGYKPNDITFIGLLNACSHAGLVEEGKRIFKEMVHEFGLVPKIEHYGCMVDLLGRAGLLHEAHEMIKAMPIRPNTIVWGALLAACKLHNNSYMGEMAMRELLEIEPQTCGFNVLTSNLYAAANRWNDVAGVRRTLKDIGVRKEPGCSLIEVNRQFISS